MDGPSWKEQMMRMAAQARTCACPAAPKPLEDSVPPKPTPDSDQAIENTKAAERIQFEAAQNEGWPVQDEAKKG